MLYRTAERPTDPRSVHRGRIRDGVLLAAALFTVLLRVVPAGSSAAPDGGSTVIRDAVKGDTVWEGRLIVEGMITVESGAVLTIRPGTEVRFAVAGGLTVHGVVHAEGTPEKPVLLVPAAADQEPWAGIVLMGGPAPSRLRSCRITRARVVGIAAGEHRVEACEITGGTVGISVAGDQARAVLTGNRLADLSEGGIQCSVNAVPAVADNIIERCGRRGIGATQGAVPEIRGNRISHCDSGIELSQTVPRVVGNTVTGCLRGIALTSVGGGGEPVRGNRVEGNEAGILCQQYADPEISGNTIVKNKDGVVCFMGAHPLIRNNDILDNDTGIYCNQISNPEVSANAIAGNRRGIYLHLSSYAVVHGNNIRGNRVQLELGNMSFDWERRAGHKPKRGLQQQNQARVERGRALPEPGAADGLEVRSGVVDAAGNWWGEETTREMEQKGPAANIDGLIDYHDVPKRTYEGYEGEYEQDRITYAPWAKERIAAAGITPPGLPAERVTGP